MNFHFDLDFTKALKRAGVSKGKLAFTSQLPAGNNSSPQALHPADPLKLIIKLE